MGLSMKKIYSKLLPHWRFIAFELCILLGGLLILPAFRLIPFVLNSVIMKPQSVGETSKMDMEPGLPSSTIDPGFTQFIPYFNHGEDSGASSQTIPMGATFFEAVDFSPGAAKLTLRIFPDRDVINVDQPVDVSFIPGDRCVFGDGRACIYQFRSSSGGTVIFASVHSGLGAEAEKFRDLVEGTGINRAFYNEGQILDRMQTLAGARVAVSQGETQIEGLALSTVVRIPPEHMTAYMQTPVEKVLDYAIKIGVLDPGLLSQNILVFETCGWRLPGEGPVPGVPDTSTAVYLGLIGLPDH